MSTTNTYLFYDIETTGLNPCFDQVLQFAAIRTDLSLRELERYEINVTLNPDVVPSPYATITHRIGVTPHQNTLHELEAMAKIHQLLNTPGTISVGYNSLGFDDEFLRFSFYRNLLSPYTHQFAQQCSRMDLYPITVAFFLYKPQALKEWPQKEGHPSLKLEYLSECNQLAQGQAHNALVDVEATVALAKQFIQQREMWDYIIGYFDKNTDIHRITQLPTAFTFEQKPLREALMLNGKLGHKNKYLAPVLNLGQHHHYKNQTLWLRLDLEELQKTTQQSIADTTFVLRKKSGEPGLLLPTKERFLSQCNDKRQRIAHDNKTWLMENFSLLKEICDYHQDYTYPKVPMVDADAALYDIGFPDRSEESLFQAFHAAKPDKKMSIAHRFPNPVRQEHALRIMARNHPEQLTTEQRQLFTEYLNQDKIFDYRNQPKLKLAEALSDIEKINKENDLDQEQKRLLDELKIYLIKQQEVLCTLNG